MNTDLLIAVLGGGNLILFVKFLIERHDAKKAKQDEDEFGSIKSKLLTLEKDVLRTQLLILLLIQPQEKQEILTLGEHYFKVLKGNWYMTSMFNRWLEMHNVAKPEWFNNN